jgi:alpha-L-fucosidase 2
MDLAIIRDLFSNCLEAARVLDIHDEFTERLAAAQSKLLPYQIGSRGQLQEWASDFQETDPHHRHTSHLFGVYPGRSITPDTPEIFSAARHSLQLRGDDGTGWALGWRINLWARFHDGDHAYVFVQHLLRPVSNADAINYGAGGGVYPNLFDAHPPFQIDGNFAFTAGVAELLVQSHRGEIELLPALPSAWPEGEVCGLRARGGVEVVALSWKLGKLANVTLKSSTGGTFRVRCGEHTIDLSLIANQPVTLGAELTRQ